ncbi:MAG: efflux RND transporter periplasmic adaptor subunit [Hyphomicrobium sp.]|nr:efflux RND transporter periplasmic adaptor subunit [Hyphomicrobium sp.]
MRKGRAIAAVVAAGLIIGGGVFAYAKRHSPAVLTDAARDGSKTAAPSVKATVAGRRDGGAGAAVAVEVARARQTKSSGDIRALGSLQSDEAVQIASEIAGRILEIPFKEGQPVKAGDVIVRLDEALAAADLVDAKARLAFAEANNERARTLSRTGNVTGRTRDEALSNFETANAAVELAQTRLAKHTLIAPFAGVAGVRSVSVGAFVPIGSAIVNIEKIDALKVDFKVPEIYLQKIQVGQKIEVTVDAIADKTFDGEIYAINPLIDVNGRALQVRARLANAAMTLRPGLFARIVIKGLTTRDVTVVPESAVVPRGSESVVYRIENGKAVESIVRLGERRDAEVEILEGLDANATVVVAGQQKLRNGAAVEVIADDQPPAKAAMTFDRSE